MAKIQKDIAQKLEGLNQKNAILTPLPISYTHLRPGHLILFRYYNKEGVSHRFCLVVTNDTGRIGYTSTQNNRLLSCFKLNNVSLFVMGYVLRRIYNNPMLAERQTIQLGLVALLGAMNYQTYMLNKMGSLYKVDINKEEIPEDEELELMDFEE